MGSGKKLLLIGSTHGSVHLANYYHLVKDYFDDVLALTTSEIDFCRHEVINFSLKNPLQIRKSIRRIRTIIQEEQPDVIHVHQANACGYITAKANQGGIPLLLTTWGSDVLLLPQKGALMKRMVRRSLQAADIVTADANYMGDAVKELAPKSHLVIANFGIDYEDVLIPEKEKVIYSNRLHFPLYNIDKIISAFCEFYQKYPDWKLVVGAKGELSDDLKALAKERLPEESYEFIGFVDKEENQRQYLNAQMWVSIPNSDGTAISLLEAMGYGCIPVVSDLPANKEWIEDGSNGVIVSSDLLSAMEKAAEMDVLAVQEKNVLTVQQKATKKVNRAIFYDLYDRCLTGESK